MSLENVLIDELRDLYSAENQLVKALPKMAKAAVSPDLEELFTSHLEETKGQVERLKQAFEQLEKRPTGKHCKGMEGLIDEGKEAIEEDEEGAMKDICLLGAALRVEHYEIAGYTAAIAIANTLGKQEVVALLTENLNEEQAASEKVMAQSETTLEESGSEDEEEDEDDTTARSSKARLVAQNGAKSSSSYRPIAKKTSR